MEWHAGQKGFFRKDLAMKGRTSMVRQRVRQADGMTLSVFYMEKRIW